MTSFEGFSLPNTTPVPDIVFDELLGKLTGNELKALLYIIRRTYGFGKNADAISLSQFRQGIVTKDEKRLDFGCGIGHNRTILAALTSLEKKGYITSKKQNTKAGDCDTTVYKLHTKSTSKVTSQAHSSRGVVTSGNDLPTTRGVVTSGNDGSYPTSRRVVTSGNTQETVLQETVLQENTFVPTEEESEDSFVGLAPDGGASSFTSNEVSDSQWLSESLEEEKEGTPGQPPDSIPESRAAATTHKEIVHTQNYTTDRATEQPTRTITPVITLPSKNKTQENGKYKKVAPLLSQTADVHTLINSFRGYALETKGSIVNENIIIRELCELHPLEHFTAVMGHLKTCSCEKHKWWREKGHYRGFKAENLRDLLPDILTELGIVPKPEESPGLLPTPIKHVQWQPNMSIAPRAALAAQ